jgi:hypothetical protein
MSVDLTDRLSAMFVGLVNHVDRSLFGEARDEIVRLREENERLKQAAVAFESRCNQHRLFAEAAGAERDRLRDALRSVLPHARYLADGVYIQRIPDEIVHQARAALGDKP